MNGPGRFRRRNWQAFVADPGRRWSTGELVRRARPRSSRFNRNEYTRVREIAAEFAEPVGYARRGRFSKTPGGLLWRARFPLPAPAPGALTGNILTAADAAAARERKRRNGFLTYFLK
jgi:hypothetical protein